MEKIMISGFSDEISSDFDEQLKVVTGLGMEYISLRTADGKSIADYTAKEVKEKLLPKLKEAGVRVSSLGSPIGKVEIGDEEGFAKQLVQLEELCRIAKVLDCRYIRIFSFYIPEGRNPEDYREAVIEKLIKFDAVARTYGVVLIHENEKGIYGDGKERCRVILDALGSDHFKAVFDFANFVQCEEDPVECWKLLHDQVVYIHIKDAVASDKENVLCGTGEGKIKEILERAVREEGYEGFLTLEPHLVVFDALKSLELADADSIIRENKATDGAEGYAMQYHALKEILNAIER